MRSAQVPWQTLNLCRERGIRSFILACLAEGRGAENQKGKNRQKGLEAVCELSPDAVHAGYTRKTSAEVGEPAHLYRLVTHTAQFAADLSQKNHSRKIRLCCQC